MSAVLERDMQATADRLIAAIIASSADFILDRPQHIERLFPGRVAPADLDDLRAALDGMWQAEFSRVCTIGTAALFRLEALQEARKAMRNERFPAVWAAYIARRDA